MVYEQYFENTHDLSNKICIITDGNNKCGVEIAKFLMTKGAIVILGVENIGYGKKVANQFHELDSLGQCIPMELHLNSLKSIQNFSKNVQQQYSSIFMLIHNANHFNSPSLQTEDGFEYQFGVHYVSLFALTCFLLKQLAPNSRIITVVPFIKTRGKIEFSHFFHPKNKKQKDLYIQSKIATMFFAKKLDERFRQYKTKCSSILCYVENDEKGKPQELILPILYGATNKHVNSGDEIAYNRKAKEFEKVMIGKNYNSVMAENLWILTQSLTNISFQFQ